MKENSEKFHGETFSRKRETWTRNIISRFSRDYALTKPIPTARTTIILRPPDEQLTFPVLQSAQELAELFVRCVRLLAAQFHRALRPFMLLLSRRTEFRITPMLARF